MREIAGRLPFWLPLATAVAVAAFSVFFFGYLETGVYGLNFGAGALLTAAVIGPGLVISCVLNQLLLVRRSAPRAVSVAEGTLVCVQAALAAVLLLQAFDQSSLAAIPLSVVIVAVAIATTVMLVRRLKSAATVSVPPAR